MQIQIKLLDPRAAVPAQGTPASAGFDLVACIDKVISIRAGEAATLIPTGVAIYIADTGYMGMILPRSGMGHKHGLVLGNTVGVIDADYQNQWFVSAWNRGQQDEIVINPGDRIAQVVFVPVVHPRFTVVKGFDTWTVRGQGGFGSTGKSESDLPQMDQQALIKQAESNKTYYRLGQMSGAATGQVFPKTFEVASTTVGS